MYAEDETSDMARRMTGWEALREQLIIPLLLGYDF